MVALLNRRGMWNILEVWSSSFDEIRNPGHHIVFYNYDDQGWAFGVIGLEYFESSTRLWLSATDVINYLGKHDLVDQYSLDLLNDTLTTKSNKLLLHYEGS